MVADLFPDCIDGCWCVPGFIDGCWCIPLGPSPPSSVSWPAPRLVAPHRDITCLPEYHIAHKVGQRNKLSETVLVFPKHFYYKSSILTVIIGFCPSLNRLLEILASAKDFNIYSFWQKWANLSQNRMRNQNTFVYRNVTQQRERERECCLSCSWVSSSSRGEAVSMGNCAFSSLLWLLVWCRGIRSSAL